MGNPHCRERMYPVAVAVPDPSVEPDGNPTPSSGADLSSRVRFVDPLLRLTTTTITISHGTNLHLRSTDIQFSHFFDYLHRGLSDFYIQDWLGGIQHTLIGLHLISIYQNERFSRPPPASPHYHCILRSPS